MKAGQGVVQAMVDQLVGARLDVFPVLGWALVLLSGWRPRGRGIAGLAMEEGPAGRDPAGEPETMQARAGLIPEADMRGTTGEGGCLVTNVAPDGELLEDLRRVYAITDNLSMFFYRALGRYDPETLVMRFGSWLDACEQAGLIGIAGVLPGDDLGQEDVTRELQSCLRCNREFKSRGIHNRLCPRCRHNSRP